MADDDAVVRITGDTSDAEASIERLKKKTGDLGTETNKSSSALKGFKFVGKELGHELGISGGMARLFGSGLTELGAAAGTAGLAIGGLSIAGLAGYKIYEHFTEETKRHREELQKDIAGMEGSTAALLDNGLKTKGVLDAQKELARFNRLEYIRKSKELIEEETNALKNQSSEVGILSKMLSVLTGRFSGKSGQDIQKSINKNNEETAAALMKRRKELKVLQEKEKAAETGTEKPEDTQEWENMLAFSQAHMKFEADTLTASRQYTADMAVLTQARIDDANREASAKRDALYSTVSFMSSSFQAMYQAGGAHARKNFSLFKMAASAEALMNADRSAASAFAWGTQLGGPVLGGALAALAYAAGLARVKSIRAMTLDGGAAGGASPVYTASPTTGAPTSTGGVNLTLIVNGQAQNIGQLTEGVVRELDRNNGTIGGISVMMERSA